MLEIIGRSIRAIAMLLQVIYGCDRVKAKKKKIFFEKSTFHPNFSFYFRFGAVDFRYLDK